MNIENDVSPSCLIVSASYFPELQCRLLLTSTAVRNEGDTSECADKSMCLRALSYIRNTKWYDVSYISSYVHHDSFSSESLSIFELMPTSYPSFP